MAELLAPLLIAAIAAPLVAAICLQLVRGELALRRIACSATAMALLCSLEAVREVIASGGVSLAEPWIPALFRVDGLSAFTMALYAALSLATLLAAPRRDANRRFFVSVLTLLGTTLVAYAAANPIVFLIGWVATLWHDGSGKVARLIFPSIGAGALATGVVFTKVSGSEPLSDSTSLWTFSLFVLAAILQEGIVPAHRSVISAFESESPIVHSLAMNGHLGIFLLARFAIPMFPGTAERFLPTLSEFALLAGLYIALLGLAESKPRRLLITVFVSQSAGILAGLTTGYTEGTTGALLQWIVLAIGFTMMVLILRSVEVRIGEDIQGDRLLGLGRQLPRLAVFFAISGLALVGLPGTLGFPGEDLLMHGALSAHPMLGIALPLAIAINAYHLYRLFAHLFMGAPAVSLNGVADALPRERWALSAGTIILVLGGLLPSHAVALRQAAADKIAKLTISLQHKL